MIPHSKFICFTRNWLGFLSKQTYCVLLKIIWPETMNFRLTIEMFSRKKGNHCNVKAPLDIALALSLYHSLPFDSTLILICALFYLGLRWAYQDGKSVCNYCDHWLWDRYWYPIYFKLSGYYDFCIRMFVQHDNLPDKRSSKLIPIDFWLFLSS